MPLCLVAKWCVWQNITRYIIAYPPYIAALTIAGSDAGEIVLDAVLSLLLR